MAGENEDCLKFNKTLCLGLGAGTKMLLPGADVDAIDAQQMLLVSQSASQHYHCISWPAGLLAERMDE